MVPLQRNGSGVGMSHHEPVWIDQFEFWNRGVFASTFSILSSPTKKFKSKVWNPDLFEGGRALGLSLESRLGTNMHQPSHKGAQFLASKSWISVWKEKKNYFKWLTLVERVVRSKIFWKDKFVTYSLNQKFSGRYGALV